MLFDLDFSDDIQKAIYLNLYEWRDLRVVRRLIEPGQTVVDIGANVGFYTLQFARLVGAGGEVHAFEPVAANRERLARNVALNNFVARVAINPEAVSANSGSADLSTTPARNSGWARIGDGGTVVPTVAIDDYLDGKGIERVHFLKCDIEGHELAMLKGAARLLKAGRIDRVMIEYAGHSLNPRGHSVREYVDLFDDYGYRPRLLNLDRVASARSGVPAVDGDTYNLLFERTAIGP